MNETVVAGKRFKPLNQQARIAWSTTFALLDVLIWTGSCFALWGFRNLLPVAATRKRRTMFLINLAIVDLLTGLITIPLVIAALNVDFYSEVAVLLFYVGRTAIKPISSLCMASIAIDAAHAVVFPVSHRSNTCRRNTLLIITGMWLTSITIGMTEVLSRIFHLIPLNVYHSLAIFQIAACHFLTMSSYAAIWVKQKQRLFTKEHARQTAENRKLLRTLMIILSFVYISSLTDFSIFLYMKHCTDCAEVELHYLMTSFLMGYLQTAADPAIYIFRIPEFKAHLVRWWRSVRNQQARNPSVGVIIGPYSGGGGVGDVVGSQADADHIELKDASTLQTIKPWQHGNVG